MLKNFSENEKMEMLLVVLAMLGCTSLVIAVIAWSNGKEIDYIKERTILMEQRQNIQDKKVNDSIVRQEEVIKKLNETVEAVNSVSKSVSEHERWIEEWKKLPSLPRKDKR